MNKIKASAPGKLMLLGEHAVVYGFPCIVTAVDKRLYVTVEKNSTKEDLFRTPQVKECKFLKETVNFFKQKFNINQGVKIETTGDFSHQVGLGSSSAVTVAAFKALSELFNISLNKKESFDMGYQVTLKVQGVGSGFDIAAASYGGTLYFVAGGKRMEIINFEELLLVVGYSGIKADTAKIVNNLKFRIQNSKSKYYKVFEEISILVERGRSAIEKSDWILFGRLMTKNHSLLKELDVSTDRLDKMCQAASDAGAWGAKLSGAGKGDCMIALTSVEKKQAVEEAIESAGGEIVKVKNNAKGVRLEKYI